MYLNMRCGKCHLSDRPQYLEDKETWNDETYKKFNNCYAYAFGLLDDSYESKPQPGDFSGMERAKKHRCDDINRRILSDHSNVIRLENPRDKCDCDSHKVTLFADEAANDYHFYRQNRNCKWSHKMGNNLVTNRDADGNIINDVFTANRKYKHHNYDTFCGAYCVSNENVVSPEN